MGDADVMINDGSAKVQLDLGWVRTVYYLHTGRVVYGTVHLLIMHNAGSMIFLCIMRIMLIQIV
jgi:hypothetical protein